MNPIPTLFLVALASGALAQSPCGIVVDSYPGSTSSRVRGLTPAFGGSMLFSALTPTGWGLFRTWGSGQVQLLQADPLADEAMVECSTPLGSRVFFVARDPAFGVELHCTDGTPAGTRMVKDIRPGGLGASFGRFTPFGARMLFWCHDNIAGSEPYITDGSAAGTFRLKDIHPGRGQSSPRDFTTAGDYALFVATDGTTGLELYVTDGTQAGTRLLLDVGGTTGQAYPKQLTRLGDKVVFTAETPAAGRELWISDGTTAGTKLLKDIFPGTTSSRITSMVALDGTAYFVANDGTHGDELWKTDGTIQGTVLVKDIYPGGQDAAIILLTVSGGRLYFGANSPLGRNLPFVSDGTAPGTNALVVPRQSPAPYGPQEFVASAGKTYFRALGGLWVTDGTPAGTIQPRPRTSGGPDSPAQMTAVGSGVCFRATDATAGWEMWFSDGTTAGTNRICDLSAGTASSSPDALNTAGGRLFFTATTPATGLELFSIEHPGSTVHPIHGASEPHHPTLTIADARTPFLGSTVRIEGQGPPGHLGFLVAGIPTDRPRLPVPGLLAGGADWVGALTPTSVILLSTATPRLTLPAAIPNVPALDGDRVNLQVWWIAAGPLQFQVSNGLQLRVGTRAPR